MESKGLSSNKGKPIIFISHRSTDKELADRLAEFFYGTGIPRDTVFCSSLPGNDVNEKISREVKTAIKNSAINIVILSRDYYQSAYCLNEAGILWYRDDVKVVPIALPEINCDNMYGFLGNEYKLRRLDSGTDIAYIYDAVMEAISAPHAKFSVIASESGKLMKKYTDFLKKRPATETEPTVLTPDDTESEAVSAPQTRTDAIISENNEHTEQYADLPTVVTSEFISDDERVVLYYILKNGIRRVTRDEIREWLHKNEICNVDVDNAFDLLTSFDGVTDNGYISELEIHTFREFISNKTSILPILEECVNKHKKLASDTFKELWEIGEMRNPVFRLFIAYIIDERIHSFKEPMVADQQIESIKLWEWKNGLKPILSENYSNCLEYFSQNDLMYREYDGYHLCPSLRNLLFNNSKPYQDYLDRCMQLHRK